MSKDESEVWRWNVDDVWQSYSSMFQESFHTDRSRNEIERYHHLSASLLFGGCTVEAILNTQKRKHDKTLGVKEEVTLKTLRYTTLREKIEKWPSQISSLKIPEATAKRILEFLELRNEVTHRKRRDHSLYKELDETNINSFVESIQHAIISLYAGIGKSFPYWILGWNYVGMNGDITHPCLLNNQQFKHSLNRFGFDVPASEYASANAWEKKFMTSIEGFEAINSQVYLKCLDIEPKTEPFPNRPRLCKRW